MTNTEIRTANVATLRKEAEKRNIDTNGMNRNMLINALLGNEEKPAKEESPKLVKMISPDGFEADVHPDMVNEYMLGDYKRVE